MPARTLLFAIPTDTAEMTRRYVPDAGDLALAPPELHLNEARGLAEHMRRGSFRAMGRFKSRHI